MLKETLLSLKMYGALESLDTTTHIREKEEYALALFQAELNYRLRKKVSMQLKTANFPTDKEWDELDPTLNPKIEFDKVKALGTGDFIRKKENLCIVGNPGTGKSHSLIALGRELCRQGFTVKFYTACELVTCLEEAQDEHRLSKIMKSLLKPSLLVIDELGFVPFTAKGASLLFNVFSSRYERGSIAVSTNLSFEKWVQLFESAEQTASLIDRFTHHARIFVYRGESIRLSKAQQKQKK